MGILLDGFRKQKRYTTNANGDHQLVSTWTHSDTVIMPDGTPLSEAVLGDGNDAVKQTETVNDNDNYEILLSQTADDVTKIEGARKSSKLKFNPYTSSLITMMSNGRATLTPNQLTISGVGGEGSLTKDSLVLSNSGISTTYSNSDIVTDSHNTWDGTNTSLKTAVTNAKGTVTQTETTTNDYYELLFSGTADDTTRTEAARKSAYLKINPSNKSLNIVNEYNDTNYKSVAVSPTGVSVLSAENGVHNLRYGADDIVFNAPSNPPTWDGTNTSLKAAIAAAAGAGGTEAVYLPLADYEELTTAEKEDPTKIYFVINEGTKVSPTLSADDGNVSASSKSGNIDYLAAPWLVFDGSDRTDNNLTEYSWMPWGQHNGEWVAYEFEQGKSFSKVHIRAATIKAHTMNYYIEGSNDGSNWTNLILGAEYVEANQPAYTGSNYVWINTDIILDTTKGSFSHIRFRQDTSIGIPYSGDGIYVANWDIYASTASNKPSIYYKNVLYNPDELPVTTISDAGKVLKVNEDGLWDKGDAPIPDVNAVQVPPVIFDDNGLKKIDNFNDFPGIEKVYLTQLAYNALTTSEKQDLSKIYYISDYEFYPSDDGKVVIRFNDDGTEKLIFFNGFVDDFNTVTPYSNFPEELRTIVTNNATWDSSATILSTNYDSSGVIRSGNERYFGIRTLQDWHVNSCNSSTDGYAAKNKENYAILDMLDNSTYQQSESWSDPYDIPYGYDAIYYGGKEYEDFVIPKELPYVTSSDAGKALVVNSQGIWVKGNIREVPEIHLGDNDKILTVESGEATWASAKKVTHLYDELHISDPLYLLGTIDPSTSPLTIDMTQHATNYEELRSTDFAFVFIAEASNAISVNKRYNPIDNDFGTFTYTPSTGQLTVTMNGGYTTGTLVGVAYKKAIIQLSEDAKITGRSGTIDCTDVPNADTLTVSDFGIVITHVTYPSTSNSGVDTVAPSISYNQTTKQLSWSVNAGSFDLLNITGYVVVGNYGDPEYRLITNFVGASSSSDGYRGYVPSPVSADKDKFLKGDGTWNPVYRELTQAEYDALPSSKDSDGIMHFITDTQKIILNGIQYG